MANQGELPIVHNEPPVSGVRRGVCWVVSVLALAGGGIAVFTSDNEIGTSTLLLTGLFAGVVALLGRVPKVSIGGNEIDPHVAYVGGVAEGHALTADAVDDAAVSALAEQKPAKEVAEAVKEAARTALMGPDQTWLQGIAAGVSPGRNFSTHRDSHGRTWGVFWRNGRPIRTIPYDTPPRGTDAGPNER